MSPPGPSSGTSPPFPLFLALSGRRVLVVGAGPAVEKKIVALADAGAIVDVVAPASTTLVKQLADGGRIVWEARRFEERDLDEAWLVVSSTNDPAVARDVFQKASARRLFVLAVDDPTHGSVAGGSVIARPPFLVAISSSGEAPALTRLLREILEQVLPEQTWIEEARKLRARWRREGTPMSSRFSELVRAFKEKAH